MNNNGYPSPVSRTTSRGEGDSISETRERQPQDRADGRTSHRNGLQSAAASLDAAFARLEQVRASLLQLSGRLAESNPQLGSRGHLGPAHDAILLTGTLVDEPGEYVAPYDPAQVSVISEFQDSLRRAVQAQSSLTQFVEQTAAIRQGHQSGSWPPPPQVRLPHRPLPPDSQPPRYHREYSRDDGVTAIGRRVAARTSPGSRNSTNSNSPLNPRPVVPPIDVTTTVPPGRPARPESGRLDPLVEEALGAAQRASQTGDLNELRRLSQIQSQLASPANSPLHLQMRQEVIRDRSRRRPTRTEGRQTTTSTTRTSGSLPADQMSRLSLLSNMSLNNFSLTSTLPSGSHSSPQRPLLFDEPEAYTFSPVGTWPEDDVFIEDTPLGRSYIVRRRVDTGGVERVQSIQYDWNDLDSQYLAPMEGDTTENPITRRRMLNNFQERTLRVPPAPPSAMQTAVATPRRRGWARLDPDGNEIPSEEEEELERHRTEYRIRASTLQARAANLARTTPMQQSSMRGTVWDSVAQVTDADIPSRHSRSKRSSANDANGHGGPFVVNPLPMSLDDMVPTKKTDKDDQLVIIVSRHASFAGR
ncbi:hypothetical protein CC1G_03763 [Coprinopsis cinerea okayama7|uniref:Uncharacterized protein n=1 Tax=Coprinopsis cinerea (strain Okayama-7 / 130 / ATCC MYA-4618 / FGSC 9003) TaxID=240176 RepID=A8N256_COPC7|nr:hypothetical protein CC1G_03763 [Coprinopsis cinerea okayama7\|eukprot:XP_001828969.1 hypothetical protein CC1G_03763 [Coprinopsis cinerea okayama7\